MGRNFYIILAASMSEGSPRVILGFSLFLEWILLVLNM